MSSEPARYLVIGYPVAHSLSPAMMVAAFDAAGLSARYDAREIRPEDWSTAMADLLHEGLAGVNVTVPHKRLALAGAATSTERAREIGAANTLVRRATGWEADNTDGPGFLDWVDSVGAAELLGREVLVLGAGGSARAVVWALRSVGCPRVRLANRTRERAQALIAEVGGAVTAEALGEPAPSGGLVVNCTSLGLAPQDPAPIEGPLLRPAALYLDLVYGDPSGVREARAAGVTAEGGLGLLVAQGARSFEAWTGVVPDRVAMRAAVEAEAARRAGSRGPK